VIVGVRFSTGLGTIVLIFFVGEAEAAWIFVFSMVEFAVSNERHPERITGMIKMENKYLEYRFIVLWVKSNFLINGSNEI
jgi:hypothetical protein